MKEVNKADKSNKNIFCLFHQQKDCICIKPVTDAETLKLRIAHDEKLKAIQRKYGIK